MSDPVIYRFQPDAMNEEILDKLLVGKRDFLNSMRKEIEKAVKNKTPRYYLILGARGIGKSHFLTLLYYKTRNLEGAASVKLSEEEYSVYRVSDLFLRILEEIKHEPLDGKFQQEDMIVEEVLENLKNRNKMIIIFMENLNQIFGEQLEKKEVKKLRTIFQENDIFIVVATSPLIFPEISQGGEPLYNFFDIKHMHELNEEEVKELIRILHELEGKSQDLELYYERVDSVIKLTGGSPRIVILLYDLMSKGTVLDIEEAFFKILDEYTPYYQDLFKLLTGQKRRIFDVLISLGNPATPKELAETARLNNNVVVTQLRRLEKDGYVISRRQGKHVKYEVRERLFRMWRELRQSFGKKRVKILIEFYTLWYTHAEREDMFEDILGNLAIEDNESIRKAEYLFWTLPEKSKKRFIPEIEKKCYEIGTPELSREFFQTKDGRLRAVSESREPGIPDGKTKEFISLFMEKKYNDILKVVEGIIRKIGKNETILFWKGAALIGLQKYEEALQTFGEIIKINPRSAVVWFSKGVALGNLGRHEEAITCFDEVLKINPQFAEAWYNKGVALENLGMYKKTIACFDEALKIHSGNTHAWYKKGLVYLKIANKEFKNNNYGNAIKNINFAMDSFLMIWSTQEKKIKETILKFIKELADSKQIKALEMSLSTILEKKNDLKPFLKPVLTALEIVKTKNLKIYYNFQIEERDIIVDIVKNLTDSEDIIPKEYRKRSKN